VSEEGFAPCIVHHAVGLGSFRKIGACVASSFSSICWANDFRAQLAEKYPDGQSPSLRFLARVGSINRSIPQSIARSTVVNEHAVFVSRRRLLSRPSLGSPMPAPRTIMPDKTCPCRPSGRHFWIDERNWPVWIDYSRAAREHDCRVRLDQRRGLGHPIRSIIQALPRRPARLARTPRGRWRSLLELFLFLQLRYKLLEVGAIADRIEVRFLQLVGQVPAA
jgi:hypothetical protein